MTQDEAKMLWPEMVELSSARGLLGLRLFVVSSQPTNGLGPVMENVDEHLAYQARLEGEGVMFAAGPMANENSSEWLGEGLFMYRADSLDGARAIAQADPMHVSGARTFTVREWLINEGMFSVQIYLSSSLRPTVR